ncbi:MAG: dihydrolipoamide acetyltransferase family protein [Leucobacter sp.]
MATRVFLLPDLGEGLTEAALVRWLVSVGDTVTTDQAIAEVETAKSVVELPTPYAGTVLALHGQEGDSIDTGSPVLEVDDGAEAAPAADAPRTGGGEDVEAEAYRSEERAGSGSGNVLIGYGTGSVSGKGRRRRKVADRPGTDRSVADRPTAAPVAVAAAPAPRTSAPRTGPVAVRSPIVRRLARELGVDVRLLAPSGADGAVTRADVLAAAETAPHQTRPAESARPESAQAASAGSEELHGLAAVETTRLSPLRKMVSAKLSKSRSEIPEATVWVDVDFTELWRLRPQMAAAGERPPSITTLVARFTLLSLQEYPLLASRLSADGSEVTVFDGVNLGLAVDSERGLAVPVLPHAEALSLAELDTALRELGAEARTGKLPPQRLSGSTFTLNNYGGFGVDGSAAIINHPEVAMLGMGRVIERPWVVDGEIVVRRIAQMSMVFDHRICDGGYASGFLRGVVDRIENPLLAYRGL